MEREIKARGSCCGNCIPARYIMAMFGSMGMAIVYGLKVNLSVAMVAMINHTALEAHNRSSASLTYEETNVSQPLTLLSVSDNEACLPPGGGNQNAAPEDGPFTWNEPLQGVLLSCYFWGYMVSELPGAHLAENYSAKWVMFAAVAINIVCTVLTPVLTKMHYLGLITMRVLEGIGGGFTFPAMHCLIASWSPPNERSVMSTIIYVGCSLGTALSILSAGMISAHLGWEAIFYVMGGICAIWTIFWIILIRDNPKVQPFISMEERVMITTSLGTTGGSHHHAPVPWKKVFSSVPFWAILISHCCSNWGWYMFLIEIPFYMKQVLKFNVSSNAALSALPYFPMLIFSTILGKLLDALKSKGKLTTTCARKIATFFASVVPAVCLLGLCFIGCRHVAAVVIMTIGIVGIGGMYSGFLSNHIDIAPNFAGTLVAITNTAATIPGICVPIFVGFMTKGNQTIGAWQVIFGVTICLFIIEFIVFTLFGSGEEQPWNKSPEEKDISENTPLKK